VSAEQDDPSGATRAPRVALDAFVKIRGAGGTGDREYVFRTRDLSESGLFLYTKVGHAYPFSVGSTLDLELYDYDEYVQCGVIVVRVVEPGSAESDHYPTGFGVKIVSIAPDQRARLATLIGRVRETKEGLY
jgi:hypothetical protein